MLGEKKTVVLGNGKIEELYIGVKWILLPKLSKVLGVLLICLLLSSFVFGALAEIAYKYFNLLLPIVFLVVIGFGIVLYRNSRRKRFAPAAKR